ncbi:MAG TPA: YCF48-related protein, partial [Blastocatellia bacterium]|nr:YCF48-related protein [Blastocatellia bacterium]
MNHAVVTIARKRSQSFLTLLVSLALFNFLPNAPAFAGKPTTGTRQAAKDSNSDLWQPQPNAVADNTFHHIWASSPTNIWASGNAGLLLHSEDGGATWDRFNVGIRYNQNNLFGVWGYGDKRIWLCGTNGLILHSPDRGGHFIPQPSGVNWRLQAIWGQQTHGDGIEEEGSNVDIFVGGDNGTVLHSADGETWAQ